MTLIDYIESLENKHEDNKKEERIEHAVKAPAEVIKKVSKQVSEHPFAIKELVDAYRKGSTRKLAGESEPIIDIIDFGIDMAVPAAAKKGVQALGNKAGRTAESLNTMKKELANDNYYNEEIDAALKTTPLKESGGTAHIFADKPSKEMELTDDDYTLYGGNESGKAHENDIFKKETKQNEDSLSHVLSKNFRKDMHNASPVTSPLYDIHLNNAKVAEIMKNPAAQEALDNVIKNVSGEKNFYNALERVIPTITSLQQVGKMQSNMNKNIKLLNDSNKKFGSNEKWAPDNGGLNTTHLLPAFTEILDDKNWKYDKDIALEQADKLLDEYIMSDNFSPLKYKKLSEIHDGINKDNVIETLKQMMYWYNKKVMSY